MLLSTSIHSHEIDCAIMPKQKIINTFILY
jgi:hypothetical protein